MGAVPMVVGTNGVPVRITNPEEISENNFTNKDKNILIKNNEIDVFIVAGQSNAVGSSEGLVNSPLPLSGNFKFFNGDIISNSDPQFPGGAGGSAWPAFGNTYKLLTGKNVCFVNTAVGGSAQVPSSDGGGLGDWSITGTLFAASITKYNSAILKLIELGYTPIIKGVLWSQGESDGAAINSGTTTEAAYKSGLIAMIARFRTTLNNQSLPFYIFRTGVFTGISITDTFNKVREQQEIAAQESPFTYVVYRKAVDFGDTDRNLLSPDGLHYLQSAYNEMGEEGAVNLLKRDFFQRETKSIGFNVNVSPLKGFEHYSPTLTNRKPYGKAFTPTIEQSSTAAYTAWFISIYEKLVGSGGKYIVDWGTGSLPDGKGVHTTKFRVSSSGDVSIAGHQTPRVNTTQNLGDGSLQWAGVYAAAHRAIASIQFLAGGVSNTMSFLLGGEEFARFSPNTGNHLIHETVDVISSAFTVGGKKTGFGIKGSIPCPRLSRADRLLITTPVPGMHVYQTDSVSGDNEGIWVYKSTGWQYAY